MKKLSQYTLCSAGITTQSQRKAIEYSLNKPVKRVSCSFTWFSQQSPYLGPGLSGTSSAPNRPSPFTPQGDVPATYTAFAFDYS